MVRGPWQVFRVYPERGTDLFYRVHWYGELSSMREAHRFFLKGIRRTSPDAHGAMISRRTMGPPHYKMSRQIGVILLTRKSGAVVISHEAVHAARYYFHIKKLKIDEDRNDERFAHVVSNLVGQIVKRCW